MKQKTVNQQQIKLLEKVGNRMRKNNAGTIFVRNERNPLELYFHQREAIQAMDKTIDFQNRNSFSGLVVLPTGGGKTITAVQWVLENMINNNKKVLWIAHRYELLEQALSAVKRSAFSNLLTIRNSFDYRLISGRHDSVGNIKETDDLIIASKDSLSLKMKQLTKSWLNDNSEVCLVIDEAHHATAKTYRKIMSCLKENVKKLWIIGLTATPFRTDGQEKGLLKKVFVDDIIYKVDLRTLISRGILAEPILKELQTNLDMTLRLNKKDIKAIKEFDSIPQNIASHIAENRIRNNRIVQAYLNRKEEYGKLLVFAINKIHAIELNKLFRDRGVASDFVISSDPNVATDVDLSTETNREKIRKFKNNELDVLINVNILTEGTDLPDVQTVFLTRPTTSPILMTQMVGRALRGKDAGGTEKAYIVSFVDEWKDKIAWINPASLFPTRGSWTDKNTNITKSFKQYLSIEKIEEFVKKVDEAIDTKDLVSLDFKKSIPLGVYSFYINTEKEKNKTCEILIYDSNQKTYKNLFEKLPDIFEAKGIKSNDSLDEDKLDEIAREIKRIWFFNSDIEVNNVNEDIKDIVTYFAQKGVLPTFIPFADREKLDIKTIAKYIYENKLGGRKKKAYIDGVWEDDTILFKVYFGNNKFYFRKCIENELLKLDEPEFYGCNSRDVSFSA